MSAEHVVGASGTPLSGRSVAVLRSDHPVGAELAAGLSDLGAAVVDLADLFDQADHADLDNLADQPTPAGPDGMPDARTPGRDAPDRGPSPDGLSVGRAEDPPTEDRSASGQPGGGQSVSGAPGGGQPGGGQSAGGSRGGPAGSAVDLVVVPVLPGEPAGDPDHVELVDLDVEGWLQACEEPLGAVRAALVRARRALAGRGGVVVVVGPVAGTVGEPGLVGYGAVGEGARALVRSCARTWGEDSIRIHSVVVPTSLLLPSPGEDCGTCGAGGAGDPGTAGESSGESSHTLWEAALGRPPTLRADVAATVAGLASPEMAFTTGTSIAVDGGVVLHS